MFVKRILTSILIGIGMFAIGCAKEAKEVKKEVDEKVTELAANDQWSGACSNVALDWIDVAAQTEHYDLGASIKKTTTYYAEDGCVTPAIRVLEAGRYEIGESSNGQFYPIDIQFDAVSITPLTESGVTLLKTLVACDFKDWQINTEHDVTTQTSENPALSRCWVKTPRALFDIVNVENDVLVFGLADAEHDRTAASTRPAQLDSAHPYHRQ